MEDNKFNQKVETQSNNKNKNKKNNDNNSNINNNTDTLWQCSCTVGSPVWHKDEDSKTSDCTCVYIAPLENLSDWLTLLSS